MLIPSLYLFILWIATAIVVMEIAGEKNRSKVGWLLLGLLWSPFALISVCAIGRKERFENKNSHQDKWR